MSTFQVEPCTVIPGSSDVDNHTRNIFYQHWLKIQMQFNETTRAIENWRQTTIENIQNYANDQIRILGEDYNRQAVVFNHKYEESLEIMRSYYSAENIDLLNDMQNTWLALQFQVAELQFIIGTMNCPKVIIVEKQNERTKQPIVSSSDNENATNKTENENSTLPMLNEVGSHFTTTKSSNSIEQLTDYDKNFRACSADNQKMFDKCPICFMIYPSSMTQDNRIEHADEHYSTD